VLLTHRWEEQGMFDFGPATLIVFGLIVIVALLIAYMGG